MVTLEYALSLGLIGSLAAALRFDITDPQWWSIHYRSTLGFIVAVAAMYDFLFLYPPVYRWLSEYDTRRLTRLRSRCRSLSTVTDTTRGIDTSRDSALLPTLLVSGPQPAPDQPALPSQLLLSIEDGQRRLHIGVV